MEENGLPLHKESDATLAETKPRSFMAKCGGGVEQHLEAVQENCELTPQPITLRRHQKGRGI
jgi:hypothetical protein